MTVTLTTTELDNFEAKLSKWYSDKLEYVVKNAEMSSYDFRDHRGIFDQFAKLSARFEEMQPKPDWKSLL